jgi:hypothetical protein
LDRTKVIAAVLGGVVLLCILYIGNGLIRGDWLVYSTAPPVFEPRHTVVYCTNKLCKASSFVYNWNGRDIRPWQCPVCGKETLYPAVKCDECGAIHPNKGELPKCPRCGSTEFHPVTPDELADLPPEDRQKWMDPELAKALADRPELIQGDPYGQEKATESNAPDERHHPPKE